MLNMAVRVEGSGGGAPRGGTPHPGRKLDFVGRVVSAGKPSFPWIGMQFKNSGYRDQFSGMYHCGGYNQPKEVKRVI